MPKKFPPRAYRTWDQAVVSATVVIVALWLFRTFFP